MTEVLDEPTDEARKRRRVRQPAPRRAVTEGLERLLDYAIVEGAELRLPLFVFLLRLARLALLEEEGGRRPTLLEGPALLEEEEGVSRPDDAFATPHEDH
jgi:hypothetical protein